MDMPIAERRQIENEMIFRRINEKVGTSLDELDAMHIADGNPNLVSDDLLLQFRCECSDEDCDARIPMKLSEYREVHLDRNKFIIKPKHQVNNIEKVVFAGSAYCVVKKNNSTAEPGDDLNNTSVHNT